MAGQPSSLGTRIRRARERARLSQEELADAVGASVRAVSGWENDEHRPRNRLGVLEEVLGVSLDGEPEPAPAIPESLREHIMNNDDLAPERRQAVIEAVEEKLREPAGEAVSAPPAAQRERSRQASL